MENNAAEFESQFYTVRDILTESVRLLGLEGKFDLTDGTDADTAFFVALLSMISTGIAYRLPLKFTETLNSDNEGKIYRNRLSKPLIKLVSARLHGEPTKPQQRSDCFVTVPNSAVELTYAWSPAALSADGVLPFTPADCSKNVFIYALCSEYCFVEGMTEESARWRSQYAQEFYESMPRRNAFLSSREWL